MNAQDIRKYMLIIRRWWWVILLLMVVTVGTMLTLALWTETVYRATSTLQVSAPPPQEVPLYSQFGRQALTDEIAQTQSSFTEFLQESNVAWDVLEKLPDVHLRGGELRDKIAVEIPDNSQLMRISVTASDPETAALLANTVVETGLMQYGELQAQPTANTRQFIKKEVEAARSDMEDAQAALAQFQIENKIGQLDRAVDKQYDLIRSLSIERDLARVQGEVDKTQALDDIILEREAELQDMIGLSADYNELVDHVERARSTFNFLLDKEAEAQIKENQLLSLSSIQIITPARPPQRPEPAINNKLIVLGGIVSFLVGILLTFLLEYLAQSGMFRAESKPLEPAGVVVIPDRAG